MVDPEELLTLAGEMELPLQRYLEWKQVVDRIERGSKAKLASLMKCHHTESVAKAEMEARASEAWKEYLQEWDQAEKNLVKVQVKLDTLRNRFDALQSVLAYHREGMKRGVL